MIAACPLVAVVYGARDGARRTLRRATRKRNALEPDRGQDPFM